LLAGEPYPERYQAYLWVPNDYWPDGPENFCGPGEFGQSRSGHGLWFVEPLATAICLDHTDTTPADDFSDLLLTTTQLQQAFCAARSARFEYGAQDHG